MGAILFGLLGLFITSFTLIPVCICIFFAIPFTRGFAKEGRLLSNHPIYKNYIVSIVSLSIIWVVTYLLVSYFGTESMIRGFIGGTIFSLVIGIWKTGENNDNVSEYLKKNKQYFKDVEEDTPQRRKAVEAFKKVIA